MKDILEKIARALPAYLADLLELVTAPKRFAARKRAEEHRLVNALVFLAVSAALAFLLKMPLMDGDLWKELGTSASFTFVTWLLFATAIWLAWRAVGGRGDLEGSLVTTFYFAGVLELLLAFAYLAFLGTLRAADPGAYAALNEALRSGVLLSLMSDPDGPIQSRGGRVAIGLSMAVLAAAALWVLAGWGAYREHHGRGRGRSALAFFIAFAVALPLYALIAIVANALVD